MKAATNLRLEAALRYAADEIWVFPCWGTTGSRCDCGKADCRMLDNGKIVGSPGKHPYGPFAPQGVKDATIDPDKIQKWWEAYPTANIAIACGPSKLVVVDVDPKNGGDDTWKQLKKELGTQIEKTARVNTGSLGGRHFFYKAPQKGVTIKNSSGKLGKGVDIRAESGYVIAPPSRHVSGKLYEESKRNALKRSGELPPPLLERLVGSPESSETSWSSDTPTPEGFSLLEALGGVEEGRRNQMLFKAASSFRGTDTRKDVALRRCRDAAAKCDPPYPNAEVIEIVERVYKTYQPNTSAAQIRDTRSFEFKFEGVGTLLNKPIVKQDWVVDATLPRGGVSLLVGKPKVGKSTIARNGALAVARGEPFLNRSSTKMVVLYFALEERENDVLSSFRRLGANDGDEEFLKIYCGPSPSKDVVEALRRAIKDAGAGLVVIDPAARVLRVKDFNAYGEVQDALEPFINLAHETNCHILLAHHFGKVDRDTGDQVIGSTALYGGVDTLIAVRRKETFRTIESVQRSGSDIERMALTFDPATLQVGIGTTARQTEENLARVVIQTFLRGRGGWVSIPEIAKAVGKKKQLVIRALAAGVEQGLFERTGIGCKGSAKTYRIATGEPPKPALNGAGPRPPTKPLAASPQRKW